MKHFVTGVLALELVVDPWGVANRQNWPLGAVGTGALDPVQGLCHCLPHQQGKTSEVGVGVQDLKPCCLG